MLFITMNCAAQAVKSKPLQRDRGYVRKKLTMRV